MWAILQKTKLIFLHYYMFPLGFPTDTLYNLAKTLLLIPKHAPVDFVFNFSKHRLSSSSQKFRYYLWFISFPQSYNQSNSNTFILFSKYILNSFTSQLFNYYPCPQSVVMWIVQWTRASSQGVSLCENLAHTLRVFLVLDYIFWQKGFFLLLVQESWQDLHQKDHPFQISQRRLAR